MIRLLLADDHTIVRSGLRLLLERDREMEVTDEASNGREAADRAAASKPDVAVLDIAMPQLNGIEAAARIARESPRTAIAILSMHSDESYVLRSLRAGARGYVLKDAAEEDLVSCVRAVATGRHFFSPRIASLLEEDHVRELRIRGGEDTFDLLTAREREILQLVAEGRATKEIAAALHLSPLTVETHRKNILEKLGLHGAADLVLYAVRKGLIR